MAEAPAEAPAPLPAEEHRTRRLTAGDGGRLADHFLRLGPDDRRLRFGGHAAEGHARAYCARLDWRRSVVLGRFVAGELRAVAELKPIGGIWPPEAELALSVDAPFRGLGVGTDLCRRAVVRARNRLVARVRMLCALANRPVQRIARRLGGALAFHPGEAEASIELPWPDLLTVGEEWLDEAAAALAAQGPPTATVASFAVSRGT